MTSLPAHISETQRERQNIERVPHHAFEHYSQLDPQWGFETGTERKMCGLTCVKAVIDYYGEQTGVRAPSMPSLLETMARKQDSVIQGMNHAVEVDMLKAQGLIAWRRNWDAPSSDVQWLVAHEGYSPEQETAVKIQQDSEQAYATLEERQQASLFKAIESGNPVIASVKPGFGKNHADHQVVLVGVDRNDTGDTFTIMDPEHAPGSNLNTETVERFFIYFNNRAIFMEL
jgi:hypothetical protein